MREMLALEILYLDKYLVVVNKPGGMLVHRTDLDPHETLFVLQILRNQLGQHVYPLHRLDKPTSGVLVFAFNEETARSLTDSLQDDHWQKHYLALVRGWFPDQLSIDRGVRADKDKPRKEAYTEFSCLERIEVPHPVGPYQTARYSLIEARPTTGRRHQIRKHLNHCSHPVLGDTWYGDRDHNRYISSLLGESHLFLHAHRLLLPHPDTGEMLTFVAGFPEYWSEVAGLFGFSLPD